MADLETPTPGEAREIDGLMAQARRVLNPPRVISPLEAAIVAVLGERFDVLSHPDLTGETWTARELAESIEAQKEVQSGEG